MFAVESYAAVRRFVFVEGHSRREAARVFGLSRDTVAKMCRFSLPPGYTRTKPAEKPKLGPLLPVIDAIVEADRTAPVKQRHTAKRIFERLRDEHGFAGGYTVVKDYVRLCRARGRETFVPLSHPPGHAQVDFGAAMIGGARTIKIHGEYVPVEAEVANLTMLSAHADSDELMRWLGSLKEAPKQVFVTHGEPSGAHVLAKRVSEELGWSCSVPTLGSWGLLA